MVRLADIAIAFTGRTYVSKNKKNDSATIKNKEELENKLIFYGFKVKKVKHQQMEYYTERNNKILYKTAFELLDSDSFTPNLKDVVNFFDFCSIDFKGKIVKYTFD